MGKIILSLLLIADLLATTGFAAAIYQAEFYQFDGQLKTFTSQDELENFVAQSLKRAEFRSILMRDLAGTFNAFSPEMGEAVLTKGGQEYSSTNIQVAGVDEADIVKTDGQYIYLVSNGRLVIVQATPANGMKVVSDTVVNGSIAGLFVNGNRLAVLEHSAYVYAKPLPESQMEMSTEPPMSYGVHLKVYDVSERENPELIRDIFVDGAYVSSRMVGDYVYAIVNQPAIYRIQDKPEVILPTVCVDEEVREIPPTQIYYSESSDIPVNYTVIIALNIQKDGKEPEYEVILTGYATSMYVSLANIYITMPRGDWWNSEGSTVIYRISINSQNITSQATGEVAGNVLNQFSMDEYQGYFRIATTAVQFTEDQRISASNVYILDADLNIVGRLEGLAPGETIYSARFIGERCYLVTFKKVDPLFTIDLSNPREPKILGKLKIPGYSDYLHPYDENHLIGIGKETVEAREGDFAWYQGLKISLFDVSNIENPKEVAKLIIGDRGTESAALRDHHALLFDKSRNLLVIPVLEAKIFSEKYTQEIHPSTHGEYIFQGAYALNIAPEHGISIRGKVTHIEDPQIYLKSGYYIDSNYEIKRSLYIGEALYTISDCQVKANSLIDLTEISTINLM